MSYDNIKSKKRVKKIYFDKEKHDTSRRQTQRHSFVELVCLPPTLTQSFK